MSIAQYRPKEIFKVYILFSSLLKDFDIQRMLICFCHFWVSFLADMIAFCLKDIDMINHNKTWKLCYGQFQHMNKQIQQGVWSQKFHVEYQTEHISFK